MKKLILLGLVLLILIPIINAAGGLGCIVSTSCPGNFTKLLGFENLTNGSSNAHVQNYTIGTYNYSLCCNSTDPTINITTTCGTIFLRLTGETNAHVQQEQINTYPVQACIGATQGKVSCTYGTSCGNSECLLSIVSSEGDNTTNAHVGTCSDYSTLVCCTFNNTVPTNVTLITPVNATLVTNRTTYFNWTDSTDADNDTITYRIQVALEDSFSTIIIDQEVTDSNFTASSNLDFDDYFWRVYANDTINWSVSITENFTVTTLLNLTLINDSIQFGTVAPLTTNDTTDDSPLPLLLRNDGNVEVNISINATTLFQSVGLGNGAYQYKADNSSESNSSINWPESTTAFANMPAAATQFIRELNFTDANDEVEIDIGMTVPSAEPVGTRNSTIVLTGVIS